MQRQIITAVNQRLLDDYAERSLKTWSREPLIYLEERDELEQWRTWRQSNLTLHPERDFAHTWCRFSHKVEAQIEMSRRLKADYMIWLDADVIEIQRPTEELWQLVLPREDEVLTYLGRGDDYHPETGFISYNLGHPRLPEFMWELEHVYLSNEIFDLEQWHDAYVWDHVCRTTGIPRRTITEQPPRRGEAFGRSSLRSVWRHHKGPRKQQI